MNRSAAVPAAAATFANHATQLPVLACHPPCCGWDSRAPRSGAEIAAGGGPLVLSMNHMRKDPKIGARQRWKQSSSLLSVEERSSQSSKAQLQNPELEAAKNPSLSCPNLWVSRLWFMVPRRGFRAVAAAHEPPEERAQRFREDKDANPVLRGGQGFSSGIFVFPESLGSALRFGG